MSIVGGMASGIEQLLRVLENPEQLRAKLEEITTAAKKADELIALAGPATEIVAMRDKLKKELEDVEFAKADTERRRSTILTEAKREADAGILAASQRAVEIRAEAEKILGSANTVKVQSDEERRKVIEDRMRLEQERSRVQTLEGNVKQREAAVTEAEIEVEGERKRLAEIARRLQADVAA